MKPLPPPLVAVLRDGRRLPIEVVWWGDRHNPEVWLPVSPPWLCADVLAAGVVRIEPQ